MRVLRLVPSDGLLASSSSKSTTHSSSSASTTRTSSSQPQQTHHTQQAFHRSWHATRLTNSPPRPFFAAIEPRDSSPDQRECNILCQKVVILAAELFPGVVSSKDLGVEYVGCGSYHEVVGLSAPSVRLDHDDASNRHCDIVAPDEKFVVRIQRNEGFDFNTDLLHDVKVLKGLEGRLSVPIPRVVKWDAETANVLGMRYTLETRLSGSSLKGLLDATISVKQDESAVCEVVKLVEHLTSKTAPFGGWVTDAFEDGLENSHGEERIPGTLFDDFPFDASLLLSLPVQTPLTYMLALVDLWQQYKHEHCPKEDNFVCWKKIKAIVLALQRHDLLGTTFHLAHGDLASRNILAEAVDDSSIKITGVVDWDFACFAPKFCAYRAPIDLWEGNEEEAVNICTPALVELFKEVASAEYVKYAFSKEAKIGRGIWSTVRFGMQGEDRRWLASKYIWDWERLHPEDGVGEIK